MHGFGGLLAGDAGHADAGMVNAGRADTRRCTAFLDQSLQNFACLPLAYLGKFACCSVRTFQNNLAIAYGACGLASAGIDPKIERHRVNNRTPVLSETTSRTGFGNSSMPIVQHNANRLLELPLPAAQHGLAAI